jgi:hypothetical protein
MEKEMNSLRENKTWTLVRPPQDANIVGSRLTYKIKTDSNGNAGTYKARLVAQGFSQQHGIDYFETLSPVISMTGLRIFFVIVASRNLQTRHMDVTTAFLNSELSATMRQL